MAENNVTDSSITKDIDNKEVQVKYYRFEQGRSKSRQERIGFFAENHYLVSRIYESKDGSVLVLEPKELGEMDKKKIAAYMAQYVVAKKDNVSGECFQVANNACEAGVAVGRAYAEDTFSSFVGWGNHCINIDELEDDTVVAFDLTASINIDRAFSVFALRAKTLYELLLQLRDLYGGQWEVMQID